MTARSAGPRHAGCASRRRGLARRRVPARHRGLARHGGLARRRRELGMVTVEYAMGTLAAAFLATVLWLVVHSPKVYELIQQVFVGSLSSLH